ncbi:MAG: TrbC family F-type conjugative pilus assembly protein [Sutterellaceae bacterium]|nr:TrbC family F-type conjugative pilus assembly protein [Sutterellaceae bacterium]
MHSFNRSMIASAILVSLASGVCAQSMFKDAPSISSSGGASIADKPTAPKTDGGVRGTAPVHEFEKLPDGSLLLRSKIHRGAVTTEIRMPQVTPQVQFNGPAGVSENGNPMTVKDRRNRQMVHAIVYNGLKANGYDFKEHQKKMKGVKTQVDEWREKTEATRREIAKNGPITTKNFIIPGSTPEISNKLNNPEVGVRMENGKRVYYLNGERIDPNGKPVKQARPQARPTTTEKTRVKASKRRMSTDETPEQTKDGKNKPLEIEHTKAVSRQAPTKAFEVPPEEDLRRNPIETVIAPNSMPDVNDVQRQLHEMFPDMRKNAPTLPTNAAPAKKGQKTSRAVTPNVEPLAQADIDSQCNDTVRYGFSVERLVSIVLGVTSAHAADNAPYSTDPNNKPEGNVFWNGKFWENVNVKPYDFESLKGFGDIVDEISKGTKALQNRMIGEGNLVTNKDKKDKAEVAPEVTLPTYMDSATGKWFDPTEFAADVVNRTKSLTPEQFDDDVGAIVNSLTEDQGPKAMISSLEAILDANPEIFNAVPDADLQLQRLKGKLALVPENPKGEQTFIFVSYSLTDEVLKDIMQRHKNRKDVTVVMRGVPKGTKLPDGMKRIQELASSVDPAVPVVIDPGLFRTYGIKQVPAVVRAGREPSKAEMNPNRENGRKYARMVAKVTGLHNDQWLMEKIEAGEKGDLGIQGEAREISEPDMIEEMKKRAAMIDWEKKKQAAIKRFWKNQKFNVLPTAAEDRLREIDPTILVDKNFNDLAGRPIRKAGDRVNPLQIRPFTQTILVFNPLSKDEMERVEAFRQAHKASGLPAPVLIATQMAKESGWDGYKDLTDRLDSHVFMMTPEIEYQWRIEKTPTVVTADNRRHIFLVKELGPTPEQKKRQEEGR